MLTDVAERTATCKVFCRTTAAAAVAPAGSNYAPSSVDRSSKGRLREIRLKGV